jgi:hypothetical protein
MGAESFMRAYFSPFWAAKKIWLRNTPSNLLQISRTHRAQQSLRVQQPWPMPWMIQTFSLLRLQAWIRSKRLPRSNEHEGLTCTWIGFRGDSCLIPANIPSDCTIERDRDLDSTGTYQGYMTSVRYIGEDRLSKGVEKL